jgi:ArsR family transcriptional regulator
MMQSIVEVEQCFKGLGDRSRLRILNLLLDAELCGCDLQRLLDTSQPNISRHLAYLKHSGLLEHRRAGFRVFYRIAQPKQKSCRALFQFLRQVFENDPLFCSDTQKLRRALRAGACSGTSPHAARLPTKVVSAESIEPRNVASKQTMTTIQG